MGAYSGPDHPCWWPFAPLALTGRRRKRRAKKIFDLTVFLARKYAHWRLTTTWIIDFLSMPLYNSILLSFSDRSSWYLWWSWLDGTTLTDRYLRLRKAILMTIWRDKSVTKMSQSKFTASCVYLSFDRSKGDEKGSAGLVSDSKGKWFVWVYVTEWKGFICLLGFGEQLYK